MKQYRFDVIIIGAGPAGVAAAGALAGTGISVALLEAGVYAGAENWSGCVYFTENLAQKDCFGPAAVAAAPFERRVHRRGTLCTTVSTSSAWSSPTRLFSRTAIPCSGRCTIPISPILPAEKAQSISPTPRSRRSSEKKDGSSAWRRTADRCMPG